MALFGIDLRAIVAANVGPQLKEGTLRVTRSQERHPSDLTAGRLKVPQDLRCRGLWLDWEHGEVDGERVLVDDSKALIVGGSLPRGVVPEAENVLTLAGRSLPVVRVLSMDPDGATITVQCRDRAGRDRA